MSQRQKTPPNTNIDPGAPFSQEAEEAVIGSVLIDPGQYISVSSFLKPADFFLLRHQYIWQGFERLSQRSEPIDLITLAEELDNMRLNGKPVLDAIGGRAYLTQLLNNAGTSVYAEVYGRLVERTSTGRKLMEFSDEVKKLALDESLAMPQKLMEVETKMFSITHASSDVKFSVPLWEALSDYYDKMEAKLQDKSVGYGIPSGFRDVDALIGGYNKSDLILLAGRPGQGKTSYLLSNAMNMAKLGVQVAIFSMEMGIEQLVMRLVSMETGINVQKLRLGKLNPQEAARFTEAIGRMSKWNIFLDDTPALTPSELRTRARRLKSEYGIDMIILDYLQLMQSAQYAHNRTQEVGHLSRTTKELAKELNVPILAAVQLSRAVEQRKDKRPILSDMRDSGELEQDADVVQFIYRDEVYNEDTEFPNQAEIITAKHRNGPTGISSLYFEKSLTKFMDASVHRVDLSDLE